MTVARPARVRAPELRGTGWTGAPLTLRALRGRLVLLHFWTSGCVNCLHVLDELRPLEERYADVLDVVGVHTPKFAHEGDLAAVRAAVGRLGVPHPVLSDAERVTWDQYAVRVWPTLVLVDPEGYEVARWEGERHGVAVAAEVDRLVAVHEARGTLRRGAGLPADGAPTGTAAPAAGRHDPAASPLRHPTAVLPLPDGLLVSDTGRSRLVLLDRDDLGRLLRAYGDGTRGRVDGAAPRFAAPRGLCALPPDVAAAVGYAVLVADTGGHLLRGLDPGTGSVRTVAGTGRPSWAAQPDVSRALDVDLSSPWDVAWWPAARRVVVAMAGVHQLWAFDPVAGACVPLAGTREENLLDGPAGRALLGQPSGLAPAGDLLWFVDAEGSALRRVEPGPDGPVVRTVVGTGLFSAGHRDGPAADALLQHPQGVVALPDGSVVVSDTYNGALRRYDPRTGTVTTVTAGLAEPTAAAVDGDALLVVESAAHRVTGLPLAALGCEPVGPDGVCHPVRPGTGRPDPT